MAETPTTEKSKTRAESAARRVAFYASERSEYAARVLDGILQYAADHVGIVLQDFQDEVLFAPDGSTAGRSPVGRPPPWLDWKPDGLIAILPHGPGAVAWAQTGGIPVVSLGSDFRGELPTIYISADSIADLAIEHFRDSGYRHFAFVGSRGLTAVDHRRNRLAEKLRRLGHPLLTHELDVNPWPGLYQLEERAAAEPGLAKFLLDAPKPLAVIAAQDHVGRAVCMACARLGLAVPSEVGVLGVDNYSAARSCIPPLSSIHAPGQVVGQQAMALLQRLAAGPADAAPPAVAVPATVLLSRQSTGAGQNDGVVVRALTLIRERACDGVPVEAILDDLAVSRSTLERQFLARVGRTPGQELLNARLSRAKELLRGTDLPVSKVAEMTGYERSSSFSDFFRRHAGMTPRAYRAGGVPDDVDLPSPARMTRGLRGELSA